MAGVSEQVRSLHQSADGTLWAGTQSSGLLLLKGADIANGAGPRPTNPVIERYGAEQGLAAGGSTVIAIADKVYVGVLGKTAVLRPRDEALRARHHLRRGRA